MTELKLLTILLCLALAGCKEPPIAIGIPDASNGSSASAQLMRGEYLVTVPDDGLWICSGEVRQCIGLLSVTADRMDAKAGVKP
jgi:hypothetical protein